MSVGYFLAKSANTVDLASHCYESAGQAFDFLMDETPDGEWPKDVVVEVLYSNGQPIEISVVEFGPPVA